MASGYIDLPFYGNGHWKAPVNTVTSLPADAQSGDVRVTLDTGSIYEFDGLTWNAVGGGGGGGSVTSVALADSTGIFNITGSPVTTTGTLTLASLITQGQNKFFAAPSASNGAPTFRLIVPGDVPTLNQNTTGTASNITATTNSTLITLSSLVITESQVTNLISDLAGKQATGNYITALTGDVTASGPGSAAATIPVGTVTDTKGALSNKPSVGVVATTNQTLSGTPTIDGQATAVNTLILLTAQSSGAQNGPWQAQTGAWTRPSWYPSGGTSQSFQFITCFVRLGTVYQGSVWRQTAAAPITIDTTATTWVVTPLSGNYKTSFQLGPVTGSSAVNLVFANAFSGTLGWNPSSSFSLILPSTQGASGTFLTNDGSGNLSWSNPVVNIDGGSPTSVYTSGQFINGGTP